MIIPATLALLIAFVVTAAPGATRAIQLGSPNNEAARAEERERQRIDRRRAAELDAMRARKARIEAELAAAPAQASDPPAAQLGREWAGTYVDASSRSVQRLTLAPTAGATLEKGSYGSGCVVCTSDDITPYLDRPVYLSDHGDLAEVFPGGVRINWVVDPAVTYGSLVTGRLSFVKVNGVRLVLNERHVEWLVNKFNAGDVSTNSVHWGLRHLNDDGTAPAFGPTITRLELPEPWFSQVVTARAEFKVTAATPVQLSKDRGLPIPECRVTLEGGSDLGAYVGMRFEGQSAEGRSVALTIDSVAEHSCEGRFAATTVLFKSPPALDTTLTPPAVGTIFSLPGATVGVSRLITDQ